MRPAEVFEPGYDTKNFKGEHVSEENEKFIVFIGTNETHLFD